MIPTRTRTRDGELGPIRTDVNGRPRIYAPWHANALSNGEVYLNRYVVAQALGRPLKPWEHVRHRDGDPFNVELDNLEVRHVVRDEHREDYEAWLRTTEGLSYLTGSEGSFGGSCCEG